MWRQLRAAFPSAQDARNIIKRAPLRGDSVSTPVASGRREMARPLQPCSPSLFSVSTTLARLVFGWKPTNQLVWRTWRQHHSFGAFLADAPFIKPTYALFREEIIDHFITPSHLKFPIHFEVFLHNKRYYDSAHRSKVPQSSMSINS